MNNLGLTIEQVSDLFYEEDVYADSERKELLFEFIDKKPIDFDTEKSSATYLVTILDAKSGIKYQATLAQSQWYKQSEANAEENWEVVTPLKPRRTQQQVAVAFAKWIADTKLHGGIKQMYEAMIIHKCQTTEELFAVFLKQYNGTRHDTTTESN
jgi:hypothetical protein